MKPNPRCRHCDEPIRWAITSQGKRIPLNPYPDPAGNVIFRQGVAITLSPTKRIPLGDRQGALYMPHFVTCTGPPLPFEEEDQG